MFEKDCTSYFGLYNQLLTPRQFQLLQDEIPSKKTKTALIYFSLLHGDIVRGCGSIGVSDKKLGISTHPTSTEHILIIGQDIGNKEII